MCGSGGEKTLPTSEGTSRIYIVFTVGANRRIRHCKSLSKSEIPPMQRQVAYPESRRTHQCMHVPKGVKVHAQEIPNPESAGLHSWPCVLSLKKYVERLLSGAIMIVVDLFRPTLQKAISREQLRTSAMKIGRLRDWHILVLLRP